MPAKSLPPVLQAPAAAAYMLLLNAFTPPCRLSRLCSRVRPGFPSACHLQLLCTVM